MFSSASDGLADGPQASSTFSAPLRLLTTGRSAVATSRQLAPGELAEILDDEPERLWAVFEAPPRSASP